MSDRKHAIIIGAGPAGLTAAYDLLTRTDILPVVLEKSDALGGLSRTVNHHGNRIDIGGHRFFSRSDRVVRRWLEMLPLQALPDDAVAITYQRSMHSIQPDGDRPDPAATDRVMLVRPRQSRIYYRGKFFDYPVSLTAGTLRHLGLVNVVRIISSYLRSALFPIRPEVTLEEFFINRFGRELYHTFFKSYTEKVWGVPCSEIEASWGAQRIKGLSIRATLAHALKKTFGRARGAANTPTSLIEQFLYPKLGPGQMWEEVARRVRAMGGSILTQHTATRIRVAGERVVAVEAMDANGQTLTFSGEYFMSTAPVGELLDSFDPPAPAPVLAVADGLQYRNFLTVGMLLPRSAFAERSDGAEIPADNWIYVQDPDVLLGRIQIFNNWSPAMVADATTVWLGLEYFCGDTDEIWRLDDRAMIAIATAELARIGLADTSTVLDATVIRMEKAYPGYFGSYGRFGEIRDYVDRFANLYLIGRNGMHRYNNQDHSMLAAMTAVDAIVAGSADKSAVWAVNIDEEYHEGR